MTGAEPAFPYSALDPEGPTVYKDNEGMSLREYAAIKLRVPNSGKDWLDDMIRTSLRDELAGKFAQTLTAESAPATKAGRAWVAEFSYMHADVMMDERESKK